MVGRARTIGARKLVFHHIVLPARACVCLDCALFANMSNLIDGKETARTIRQEIKDNVEQFVTDVRTAASF